MGQTRRQFVGTAVAAGAALGVGVVGVRAAIAPGPARLALDAFVSDPKRLESLRRGVAVMKSRLPSDHKSWFFQGAIHAYSDALYQDALARDAKLSKVDSNRYWNRCPHFGQASADFVIWHRAYLHYFERVLRDAASDPDLALPYWNYALPADRVFPDVFGVKFVDSQRTRTNPLYHPNRELAFVSGRLELSGAIGEAHAAHDAANFFHEPGVPGLAGDHLGPEETQIGLLEQRPHNDIHLAVGGVVNSVNGAMAEITTAAFDPVFWVHHANIDRMWAEWMRNPGKRWGTMPPDDWWNEKPWVFLDVDGTEQSMSRRDYLELESPYDTISGAPSLQLPPRPQPVVTSSAPVRRGTRAEPPPSGAAAEAAPPPAPPPPPKKAAPQQRQLISDAGAVSLTPQTAAKRSVLASVASATVGAVAGGSANRDELESAPRGGSLAAPQLGSPGARVFLELSGIRFDRVPSSGFAVFLDRSNGKAQQPVGLLDLFGATHAQMPGMAMHGAAQRFDVTRVVKSGAGPFTLRIEPYDLLVTRAGNAASQRRDAVHIDSVKFVVVS
ncbi:MAG TPA: tyrosinase family protein [Rhizomicrobium sp.]|jgi:hypothetical protein|nr:tyrosinase family protein [Rhizomicrobium sp.]